MGGAPARRLALLCVSTGVTVGRFVARCIGNRNLIQALPFAHLAAGCWQRNDLYYLSQFLQFGTSSAQPANDPVLGRMFMEVYKAGHSCYGCLLDRLCTHQGSNPTPITYQAKSKGHLPKGGME